MSKALPYAIVSRSGPGAGGRRVFSQALWMSGPLLIGATAAAASWGQMSWWPSVALTAVYGVGLLGLRPAAPVVQPRESSFEIGAYGVVVHDEHAAASMPWSEVQQVDMVAFDPTVPGEGDSLFFVLLARERQVVVPASQALTGRLIDTMGEQLGALDQNQFLRALSSRRPEARFTLWQRA